MVAKSADSRKVTSVNARQVTSANPDPVEASDAVLAWQGDTRADGATGLTAKMLAGVSQAFGDDGSTPAALCRLEESDPIKNTHS
jgi:hypothetical protein